ncbi:eukaryotic translation initiation factor 5 [Ceraceosorus bombacis]|uniref:Eukaryotic translation initiation factor 5 n=1 Tax=Ceraceosorus bombacis TaxID=401625 RepID=A0A0P1B8Q7_9BASI|nr:eukaryotic translation initiation factor 5 [Ceraceosorus bombacis]
MAVVNIRRDVEDQFYRYRMPLLQTKIEGRGNGIKTVVPNMSDIARALSRPATYPTKFFGFELGAQTQVDDKNDRYIVNGAHQADALRKLLDDFITKFVLCGSCKNPETDLKIMKDGMIIRDCKACGKRSDVDMRHKLTTFITKNPPPKKAKGSKGAGKSAGQSVEAGEEGVASDEEDDDEMAKQIAKEAKDTPIAKTGKDADENVEWSVDTSEAAVRERAAQALSGSMQASLVLTPAGVTYPSLVPNGVPKILMALYQLDVLEEEVVQTWGKHVSKKYVDKETSKKVRKAAAPFLTWLEEADDDDEEEEEDDLDGL